MSNVIVPSNQAVNNPNNYNRISQAKALKVAAVAIAAPRYMGAFGAAIGIEVLQEYSWLATAEIFSGGAMALLEGFALAFVLSKWRLLKPGSVQWYILLTMVILLALTLPLVALPYLLVEQNQQSIAELFAGYFALQAGWSFLVAGVPMLVIMAVGFADVDEYERQAEQSKQQANLKQAKQQAKQATEQANKQNALLFTCEHCNKSYETARALNGHKAHCKAKANGQAIEQMELAQ